METNREPSNREMFTLAALVSDRTGDNNLQLEEAKKLCDKSLAAEPDNPDLMCMRGMIDCQLGDHGAAEAWMEKALIIAPRASWIIFNYAIILLEQKKYMVGLQLMRHFVTLHPNHVEAHWHIGQTLRKVGNTAGALEAFSKARKINPEEFNALNDRGISLAYAWSEKGSLLKKTGQLTEACACYEKSLCLNPNNHMFLNNLGVIHYQQNHLETAAALYHAALSLNPAYPEAYNNLSNIDLLKGDTDAAIRHCQKALELRPHFPDAINNLGNALNHARRFEEAIHTYEEALRFNPDDAEIHSNLAIPLLTLGHFDKGWEEYEWRWKTPSMQPVFSDFTQPRWQGEDGLGCTILISAEGGFGDILQFCRYIPLVKARGFRVVIEVPTALNRIIQSLEGVDMIVATGETLPPFDLYCPIMSLPSVFHTTVETIPAVLPYLTSDPQESAEWRNRVDACVGDATKVGLVWAGRLHTSSPDYWAMDRQRSIPPELLITLMDVQNVQFFSLQKDGTRASEAFPLIDWMADCRDFADTAALIMSLDLVISVDTAVAHLAGALGKPVWLLNRFNSCWRWLADREDSPWYPGTFRIFNQKEMGSWEEVVVRVHDALVERGLNRLN